MKDIFNKKMFRVSERDEDDAYDELQSFNKRSKDERDVITMKSEGGRKRVL